jgi:single-stranded-DNA-specific exonuclease
LPAGQTWMLRRRTFSAAPPAYAGLDPLLARILYARKIEDPAEVRAYLSPAADEGNPFLLKGMRQAVARLFWAVHHGERIVVYGDYDTDGVTATALVLGALERIGAHARPYIPDRFSEAYGLNTPALESLRAEGADLVVTVDCGIRSVAEVARAAEIGLEMIVTDHHSVPEVLPEALAVIDPKQPGCPYPFEDLAGVGLAYRLVQALYAAWNATLPPGEPPAIAEQFLDLVALGTVADIVPLTGENRALVRQGLEVLRTTARPGLRALMEAAGVPAGRLDAQAIAFRLGPRLNAAGRLESAEVSLGLLTARDPVDGRTRAARLNEMNQKRQQLLERQVAAAEATLAAEGEIEGRSLLFVARDDLNEGIVGLIASRLADQYYLPTVVMRANGEGVRGSARSIEGFHITQALDACAAHLGRYGGHAMAAGFSLPTANLAAFRRALESHAAEYLPAGSPLLNRRLDVDALVPLGDLTLDAVRALGALEPCGEGNPPAVLATTGLTIRDLRPVGREGQHCRLYLADGASALPAIAFRMGEIAERFRVGDVVDVAYTPSVNAYNGSQSVQLEVQAIRRHGEGA